MAGEIGFEIDFLAVGDGERSGNACGAPVGTGRRSSRLPAGTQLLITTIVAGNISL
jgi:hypothetical protein